MRLALLTALTLCVDRPMFLSAGEMVKLMTASPRKYTIAAEEHPYEQWTQLQQAPDLQKQTEEYVRRFILVPATPTTKP